MRPEDPGGGPPDRVLDLDGLQQLLDVLTGLGYSVIGPVVRGGAVVPGPVRSVADLPAGWGDEQDGGTYRLHRRDDGALFGYASAATSWKSVLFPARELLWSGSVGADGFSVEAGEPEREPGGPPYALLGVRSCDLHAVAVQDRVLLGREKIDAGYAARRRETFVVSVTCANPGGTCFCVSMGTGPRPDAGFDLSLTELVQPGRHRFVVRVGSERGAQVLAGVRAEPASGTDRAESDLVAQTAATRMGRRLDTDGIRDLLYDNAEHPRWDDVASRCLSCANCTLVCPTCFCTSTEDTTSLTGENAERWRVWDSCFTTDFSHLHGGSVRASGRSRYRQWMTHKLASWIDQFGTSGCVGCGRCITWCPVAIDITEEAAAIRWTPAGGG